MGQQSAQDLDVVVVGSGPNGLATAIEAQRRGLRALVIERGQLAENVSRFPVRMVFFGLGPQMEIAGVPCDSPLACPTREEMLHYLSRVARLTGLEIMERTCFERLEQVAGGFNLRATREGKPIAIRCRKVVLATGVFGQPNQLDVPGADLPKVTCAYEDPYRYRRQRVVIVGAGNGAAEAALRLRSEADAEVTVLNRAPHLRRANWRWSLPDVGDFIAHGEIRVVHGATVERIEPSRVVFSSPAGRDSVDNDHVIVQIGYRPDPRVFAGAGATHDQWACPQLDPLTLETSVPGVYVAGHAVSNVPNAFLITGTRNHCKVIVSHILGEAEPRIRDLGIDSEGHWAQFAGLDGPDDPDIALELVPVVVGDFQHQLLDIYQPLLAHRERELLQRGVAFEDRWNHPLHLAPALESLPGKHLQVRDDGTMVFKGERLPADALEVLRLADGTRRIRDIVADIADTHPDTPADSIVRLLIFLLRQGKLVWRAAPLAAPEDVPAVSGSS